MMSGCSTANRATSRALPGGEERPCAQSRTVPTGVPSSAANAGCETQDSARDGTTKADAPGVEHLSGNVWDWCFDEYAKPKPVWPGGTASRAGRGGGCGVSPRFAHAGYRFGYGPGVRGDSIGFRVVCAAHIHRLHARAVQSASDRSGRSRMSGWRGSGSGLAIQHPPWRLAVPRLGLTRSGLAF